MPAWQMLPTESSWPTERTARIRLERWLDSGHQLGKRNGAGYLLGLQTLRPFYSEGPQRYSPHWGRTFLAPSD
jgi:hypothetical protein